jgi:hypothetical protein
MGPWGRARHLFQLPFIYELTSSDLLLFMRLPWVERRQEGRLLPWGRARHLSQLPLSRSLPWVERQQERRLSP